ARVPPSRSLGGDGGAAARARRGRVGVGDAAAGRAYALQPARGVAGPVRFRLGSVRRRTRPQQLGEHRGLAVRGVLRAGEQGDRSLPGHPASRGQGNRRRVTTPLPSSLPIQRAKLSPTSKYWRGSSPTSATVTITWLSSGQSCAS